MARRIPLPRLTRRQRLARWQRERRQRLIYLASFTTLLVFVLGLVAWSGATRYYDDKLKPAARVGDRAIPMRDFNRRLTFEKVRFLRDVGIPEERENDPQLRGQVSGLRKGALDQVVLGETLVTVAREDGSVPSRADVDARVDRDYGELHVRHVLLKVDADATDKTTADADAKAKAQDLAKQLKADPISDQLWRDLAAKNSDDPGTKDNGGDLGWVNASSGFVKEFEDAMYALSDGAVSDPVRSSFGYHIIQRVASRPVTQTTLWPRLRKNGLTLDDLRLFARTALLRDRYEEKVKSAEIPSPQEQVRLAQIVIRLPPPTNFQLYGDALRRINAITDGLAAGQDFGKLAKDYSDDLDTKDKNGEIGWVTRSMLPNTTIADDVFSRKMGERSDQHSLNSSGDIGIYLVLEKSGARPVDDEQKTKIREEAFTLWLAGQRSRLGVLPLIPGLEF